MNRQIAFDIAVSGIIAQGGRSANSAGTCAYRGERGRKCAIGFLIKDEDYRPEFEGFSLNHVANAANIRLDSGFMLAMQELHDLADEPVAWDEEKDSVFLECFKERAREFAADWALSPKVLDEKPVARGDHRLPETELEPA